MKTKQISLYVDEDQYKELQHIAVDEDTSVSEIMRQLIDDYLKSREEAD